MNVAQPSRTVVLLAVAVVVAACGSEVSPSASAAAPSEPSGPVGEEALQRLSWLSARGIEDNDVTTAVDLSLVRGDGTIAWQESFPLDPVLPGGLLVVGPRNGVAVIGTAAGRGADLRVVRASDGSVAELLSLSDTPVGAALDSAGEVLYVAVSGDELRVVEISVATGEVVDVAHFPPDGRLILTWDRLALTPDGRRLVFDHCIADGCIWDVIDLATGAVARFDADGAGGRIDLANDLLLAGVDGRRCGRGPCPFVLVDLDDGSSELWDPGAHTARLGLEEDGRTVLLHDDWGLEGGVAGRITLTDPATGASRAVVVADARGQPLGLARVGQDAWVPIGWELVAPPGVNIGEAGGPTLLRLADGIVRHLAAPASD